MLRISAHYFFLLIVFLLEGLLLAQDRTPPMPKKDVIDVSAISDGLCVSNLFQSNMVLQRDKPIVIWGWATPEENITVAMGDQQQTVTTDWDRSWRVSLPAMSTTSDPQTLTITGKEKTLSLENILIGDVWILGGQSNMEFPLDRIENGELEIVSAHYPNIRILTVPAQNGPDTKPSFPRLHEWSSWFGQHYRKGDWDPCTPEVVRELSAIGYVFARRIHMASQVPIGVIDASRGGTTVETWTPDSVLRKIGTPEVNAVLQDWDQKVQQWDAQVDLEKRIKSHREKVARFKEEGRAMPKGEVEPTDLRPGPAFDPNHPGNCFASMIGPLQGLQVKGAIFHQGYNNCFNGTEGTVFYRQVFPEMIASWRSAFNNTEMAFGIVSLFTEGTAQTLDNYCEMMANPGPYIREAQYQTFLDLYQAGDKNIGFASSYDLRRRWYHPQLKIPAGERIARWALATQYDFARSIRWKPPMVKEVKSKGDRIELQLDEPANAVDNGGPILGFAIAGEDRKFQPATAEYLVIGKNDRGQDQTNKRVLILKSPLVSQPVHYRYAWGRSPLGNLQAERNSDIPFATQRSDKWPLENVPLVTDDSKITGKLNRQQQRSQTEALKKQDVMRILAEAEAMKSMAVPK